MKRYLVKAPLIGKGVFGDTYRPDVPYENWGSIGETEDGYMLLIVLTDDTKESVETKDGLLFYDALK